MFISGLYGKVICSLAGVISSDFKEKGSQKRLFKSKNEVTFSPRGVPGLSGLGTEGITSRFHMKSSPKFFLMCFKKQMRHQRPKARQMQSGETDILKTSLL